MLLASNYEFDKFHNRNDFLFVIQYNGLEDYKLFYFFQFLNFLNFFNSFNFCHFLFFGKMIFLTNGKISGLIDQSAIGIFFRRCRLEYDENSDR